MKKLFFVLAIAALASCNSGSKEESTTSTETAAPATTETAAPAPTDTTATAPATTDAQPASAAK